jgi:hypothetical protein
VDSPHRLNLVVIMPVSARIGAADVWRLRWLLPDEAATITGLFILVPSSSRNPSPDRADIKPAE